jgi:hypothetical protein
MDLPVWVWLPLLFVASAAVIWLILLAITFMGLWLVHPRDAHDDINISDRRKH